MTYRVWETSYSKRHVSFFCTRSIVLLQLATVMLINPITMIYFLHVRRKTATLLVFHQFFMHLITCKTFPRMFFFFFFLHVFCLFKYLTQSSRLGMKLKRGTSGFPISMLISSFSLFSQLLRWPWVQLASWRSPSGTWASSWSSVAFTYSVDRGGGIMWQLRDDGRLASHRSDTRSSSDLLFAT